MTITPVILSGGSGTRLWPVSTEERPKQFLNLIGGSSLLQQSLARVADRRAFGPPIVVGSARHRDLLLEQLAKADIADARVVLEPVARNTAAAIGLAARLAPSPDTLLLVMPSDHAIEDIGAFHRAIELATGAAEAGQLITFGIEPTGPETGYGYIAVDEAERAVRPVRGFVEKPDRARAETMLARGHHYWNAGIFLFRADAILDALRAHEPAVARAVEAAVGCSDGPLVEPDRQAMDDCPSVSIDVGVMERSDRVGCVPVSMGWSDVGSWDSLGELMDGRGHTDPGVLLLDAPGSRAHSDGRSVTISGVANVIVIATADDVLVIPRGESQRVKDVVQARKS